MRGLAIPLLDLISECVGASSGRERDRRRAAFKIRQNLRRMSELLDAWDEPEWSLEEDAEGRVCLRHRDAKPYSDKI